MDATIDPTSDAGPCIAAVISAAPVSSPLTWPKPASRLC